MASSWWVVSYYTVYGRTVSPEQFTVVEAPSQAAAIAAAKTKLGGHATGVGELVKGPYSSQAAAQAQESATSSAAASGTINPSGGPAGQPTNFPNPLNGLAAIGKFFSALMSGNLWLRVAKVVVGAGLLIAGIAKLTGTEEQVLQAAKAVKEKVTG